MFTRRSCFLGILLIAVFITGGKAATLHGTIYQWSDFDNPLKDTIVEVNSTPAQYMVATTGTYSFNLTPGTYLIKARYYHNNILEYTVDEVIRIDMEGDFVHDLLLFPPVDSEYLGDINLTSSLDKNETNPNYYVIIILVLAFSGLMITYWIIRKKGTKSTGIDPVNPPEKLPEATGTGKELPEDLRNLMDTILKTGGRTTQKDLRKKIAYSEAKVSLMLDDLEDRGLIKK